MALLIGRAGKTLALNEPSSVESSGGNLSLRGFLQNASVADALRLRDQVLGYQDNSDEPIVPVTLTGDARLNGYYRVLSVKASTIPATIARGWCEYEVGLDPVQGYAQPYLESIMNGGLLPNVVGAVVGDMFYFHAVPSTATEYARGAGVAYPTARGSADGNINFTTGGTAGLTVTYALPVTDFYIGAATFEQGAALQPVVGRQLVQADPYNWRLSNGMVRVTPSAALGRIDVAHWKAAGGWAAAKTYDFGTGAVPTINGFTSVTVLRNSVEQVVIRLSCTNTTTPFGVINIDLSLRRGERNVRGFISVSPGWASSWSVGRAATEAATAITYGAVTTGGMRATANDADGNRYVLLAYQQATTSDLVFGRLTGTASRLTFDFAIGSEIGGSLAAAGDNAVDQAKQYLMGYEELQRVVAR